MIELVSCGCDAQPPVARASVVVRSMGIVRVPGQLDPCLLGYYPLGDRGGEDISGRDNHATPSTESITTAPGILCEQAEVLSGNKRFDLPFTLSDRITVSCWAKFEEPKLEQTLLSIGDHLRFGISWYMEPIIWINERSPNEMVVSGDPIEPNKFVHIAFVRDCEEYRVVINGERAALRKDGISSSRVIVPVETPPGAARLSSYRDSSEIHGAIQDVVIRNSAMVTEELRAEYQSYCNAPMEFV